MAKARDVYSPYGYWFSPSGEVYPLETAQSHAEVIVEIGEFDLPGREPRYVMQYAIDHGWIAVSISPVGTSIGIRIREHVPERDAITVMRSVLKADNLLDAVVHTDLDNGTASEVITNLRRFTRDSYKYPNIEDEIESVLRRAKRDLVEIALGKHIRDMSVDTEFDTQPIEDVVVNIRNLAKEAKSIIKLGKSSRTDDFEDQLRRVRQDGVKLVDYANSIHSAVKPLFYKVIGFDCDEAVKSFEDGYLSCISGEERLHYVKAVNEELQSNNDDGWYSHFREMFPCLTPFHASAERIASASKLVPPIIETMEGALGTAKTIRSVHGISDYHIGLDSARIFNLCGNYYLKDLWNAISRIRN